MARLVVAPTLAPTRAGDRVGTEQQDAERLAREEPRPWLLITSL
jgi:hypothetical protein